ncbi:MAG: AGE family epimerase/isomerase [bacterium]
MNRYLTFLILVLLPRLCYSGNPDALKRFDFDPGDSPYLQNPEMAIGFVDSSANFWRSVYDSQLGGFYSDVDKFGNAIGSTKHLISQTRNAYGFVRAYMLTGKPEHLEMAEAALEFMYQHNWDHLHGGWHGNLDRNGEPVDPFADKTAFNQHYALLGIAAYFEATRDTSHWNWLIRGYDHLENVYWDSRSGLLGYYDVTDFDALNARNKSFNATVDAITTHLLYLYLMTEDPIYKTRLQELADEIIDHLVASMPAQAIGFVEKFDSNWNRDNSQTMTAMGHVLKSGWCLGRIYQIDPNPDYITNGHTLLSHVWDNAYDHEFGGPYKDYDRVTGEMLLHGLADTSKAWWQMEQAVTAGLQLFEITGDSTYWHMADESLDFFMTFFVDREFGEVYADRTRRGDIAYNENKGSRWKAAYHSTELGYYVYLYGNLLARNEPVTLHYNFTEAAEERGFPMTPLAIADSKLRIKEVLHEGQVYTNFDPEDRILTLPAGVVGHFEVTYERTGAGLNRSPIVVNAIDPVTLVEGGDQYVRDLTAPPEVFSDPDDDQLTFSAISANPEIAAVSVMETELTLEPRSEGTTTASVTANDGKGGEISTSFSITVLARLSRPLLFLPPNGAADVTTSPVLAWTPVDGATSYRVQVATAANFADSILVDAENTSAAFGLENLEYSVTYYWRVRALNEFGESEWSEVWHFTISDDPTSVDQITAGIPRRFGLSQNYPNPFNPKTSIEYQLPKQTQVKLTIYNLVGQRVITLADQNHPAGYYTVQWDGTDHAGRRVASGVYLYRLETTDFVQVRKVTLIW